MSDKKSSDEIPAHLAGNIRQLRKARGLTQAQLAKLASVPRPTIANLESGAANPTLVVLLKVAAALQIRLEELISTPRAVAAFFKAGTLPVRKRGDVTLRSLLPDEIPGVSIDRMTLPPGARMAGVPHMPGTREYLTCEHGEITLHVAGEKWALSAGDVVVFRGDQAHSYRNDGRRDAVGYSVVLLAPLAGAS